MPINFASHYLLYKTLPTINIPSSSITVCHLHLLSCNYHVFATLFPPHTVGLLISVACCCDFCYCVGCILVVDRSLCSHNMLLQRTELKYHFLMIFQFSPSSQINSTLGYLDLDSNSGSNS
ncbi:hypothetical protein Pint_05306 [Pistacia integerrima]|uniref:Uncharacterized protein n=1 Tax=Pistacia integerrima TaxID=434235 RepID=A0ACC0Z828_9ROSI|nr:hypothetical protein Pint_05306 [Pistacia integerrima]